MIIKVVTVTYTFIINNLACSFPKPKPKITKIHFLMPTFDIYQKQQTANLQQTDNITNMQKIGRKLGPP